MDLVWIRWIDSRGAGSRWIYLKDLDHSACICESVGWVIHETDDSIEVAPHRTDWDLGEDMQVTGEMVIPKVAIQARAVLKVGL